MFKVINKTLERCKICSKLTIKTPERSHWRRSILVVNPNLGRKKVEGRGNFTHCWFSLDHSETVKVVTLQFCIIQYLFIRHIRTKFGIPNSSHFPDIGQKSDGFFSNFWISGQSVINENSHNSRTSNDIDMRLGTMTKLEKENTTIVKN